MALLSRSGFEMVATGTLVVCALAMTGMTAVARFRAPPDPSRPTAILDWAKYATGAKRFGPRSAAVTVVEFSDFQCPFCVQFYSTLELVRSRHAEDVQVVFRNFPIGRIHPLAVAAARAVECAAGQGRFKEYHAFLFENQDSLGVVDWVEISRRVGIANASAFGNCVESPATRELVTRDSVAAAALGVTGTPTVLINGWRIVGAPSEALLDSLITSEIAAARRR